MAVSRLHRTAALALLIGASAIGSASAADLLPPPPPPPYEAPPVEIGGGWYLRADFTESYYGRPKDATLDDPANPLNPLLFMRMSHAPGYGGGVGYKFNTWLRMDVTIDQRNPSRFSTYSSGSGFTKGQNIEAGSIDSLTGLFNVYADLGNWYGLTPYIGGGVGVANTSFAKGYTQTTCYAVAPDCDGQLIGAGARPAVARGNRSTMSLAWALMGGVSYEIGGGLSLDASYRYVNFGRAKSGLDEYGYRSSLKDITANEVRVGLRYSFAGGPGVFGESSYVGSGLSPYGH